MADKENKVLNNDETEDSEDSTLSENALNNNSRSNNEDNVNVGMFIEEFNYYALSDDADEDTSDDHLTTSQSARNETDGSTPTSPDSLNAENHQSEPLEEGHSSSGLGGQNSSERRAFMISDFMQLTAVKDVAQAIGYLVESEWNLMDAVAKVIPENTQMLPSEQPVDEQQNSGPAERTFNFTVTCESTGDSHDFVLTDRQTIQMLKNQIFEVFQVPIHHQKLLDWPNNVTLPNDDAVLSHLDLPETISLQLVDNVEPMVNRYAVRIRDHLTDDEYVVSYTADTKVADIKHDLRAKLDIPVSNQEWIHWPNVTEQDPTLTLQTLAKRYGTFKTPDSVPTLLTSNMSFSVPQMLSIHYDMRTITVHRAHRQNGDSPPIPLVSDYIEEIGGCIEFSRSFEIKYSSIHPHFHINTLEGAVKEALFKPALEKKMLTLYLHSCKSPLTDSFCQNVLCKESIMHLLNNRALVYGFDLTVEHNEQYVLNLIGKVLGPTVVNMIKTVSVENFPVLVLLNRSQGNINVLHLVTGTISLNELASLLMVTSDIFVSQQKIDHTGEQAVSKRQTIKNEQDEAYRHSLQVDRAKAEIKRKLEQEAMELAAKIDNEKRRLEAQREENRKLIESQLPAEPDTEEIGITRIRIRMPGNVMIERRFLVKDKLQILINFAIAKGFPYEQYRLVTSFPRIDLSDMDKDQTLEQLKLYPQQMLVIEER